MSDRAKFRFWDFRPSKNILSFYTIIMNEFMNHVSSRAAKFIKNSSPVSSTLNKKKFLFFDHCDRMCLNFINSESSLGRENRYVTSETPKTFQHFFYSENRFLGLRSLWLFHSFLRFLKKKLYSRKFPKTLKNEFKNFWGDHLKARRLYSTLRVLNPKIFFNPKKILNLKKF